MKMVKNLTLVNIKKIEGLERIESLDFHDDGNSFKGFAYKGIPITTLRTEGKTFLSIRIDNMNNNFTYKMWSKIEESNLCHKYNGVEEFNLEELIEDINKIIIARNNLQEETSKILKEINYKALDNTIQKEIKEASEFIEYFKNNFAWFNVDTYELSMAKTALDSASKEIETIKNMDLSKCQPYMILNMIDRLEVKGYAMLTTKYNYYYKKLIKFLEKYSK